MTWLVDHGYEPVDHGPFVYDALDDYPCFCLRAAEGVAGDRAEGLDSLGVVIGGSGNGEQMAANKVEGIRCALVWSEETAVLAREHNDANVVSVGGRMHSRGGHGALRGGLPVHAVHRGRAPRPPDRPAHDLRHQRRAAAAARLGSPGLRWCLRGTPSGGSPTDLDTAFAGRRVRVGSPAGPVRRRRRRRRRQRARGRRLRGQAPLRRARARPPRPRAPRADRHLRRAHRRRRGAAAGGPGPAADRRPGDGVTGRARRRTPTCAAPRSASSSARPGATRSSPGSDPTRCASTPTPSGPGGGSRPASGRSATCSWTRPCWRGWATSTGPRCCSGTGSTRCGPARPCGSASGGRSGTTWST